MDTRTDLLTEILELSAKHFNENNYIIIANMLKEIHGKKKNIKIGEFKKFEVPVIIKTSDSKYYGSSWENSNDIITIIGYKEAFNLLEYIYSTDGSQAEDVDNYKQIKSSEFKDLLKILFKLNNVLRVKIESKINENTFFNYIDYKTYLIELAADDDDFDIEPLTTLSVINQYYDECVDIIYMILTVSLN